MMSSLKFYIILIFIPQLLWLLSNQNGVLSICESCSSNFQGIVQSKRSDQNSELLSNSCDIEHNEEVCQVTNHKKVTPPMKGSTNMSLCVCSKERNEKHEALQLIEDEPHGGWYVHVHLYLSQPI